MRIAEELPLDLVVVVGKGCVWRLNKVLEGKALLSKSIRETVQGGEGQQSRRCCS